MNSSLWSADRMTHVKIVATSLVLTLIVVVAVGSAARIADERSDRAQNYVDPRPAITGKPATFSAADSATIR